MQSIPAIAIASLTLYAGLYHLGIYLRRRSHREHFTFALSCLAMGLYDIFCAGLYSATTVGEGVLWQQRQIVTLAVVSLVFPWFVNDYLAVNGLAPRWWKRGLLAFSVYFVLAALLGLLNPAGLYWPANAPSVKEIVLPWGATITYYEMSPGPLTNVQSGMGLLVFLYILGLAVYVYFRGQRRPARPLLAALGLFFVSAINDTAVSSGLYGFAYTMEYAYLGMVLLMTTSLSIQVAEAAAMKEVLAQDVAERQRAEETLRRYAGQLEALRHVGLELTAQLDLDSLLHTICTAAIRLLEGNAGGLYLYQPERDVLTWSIGVGANLPAPGATLRRDEGLGGTVWERGRPLLVDNYPNWEGRASGPAALRSAAAVSAPVRWGDELLGVLVVTSDTPGAFDQADVEMLTLFANQSAVAIRNARLYEEAHGRAERLAVLNHIAAAVGATLDLDALLETVYRETTSIFPSDSFFIALYDEASHELEFRFQMDEGVRVSPDRQPADVGLTSLVIAQRRPLLIRDMEQEAARLPTPSLWGSGRPTASWLGVPMQVGDRLLGVICVQAYRPHAYSDDDQLLLSTIADQIAMAVDKAQLYQGLHDSEEKYRTLFEQANDAVFITTLEGRILEANERAGQLLGYRREELLQRTLSSLMAPAPGTGSAPPVPDPIQSGARAETEYLRQDGSRVAVEVSLGRLRVADQDLLLALVHDISRRKQTEEQLRQAQKMEAIGTLAGGVAHDFNNILTSILGYASLVQQELPPDSPLYRDMETILNSARRAADLTAQLLTFARRSSQTELRLLDPNDIVREVVKLLERTIDKAIAIEMRLSGDLAAVRGDSSQLHQALLNLCLNARDAMPRGGRLLLETRNVYLSEQDIGKDLQLTAGDYVVLSVSDTGEGIDPTVRGRIFEPFFTTKEHGRGLGLAMVYGIVRGHGGAVHVYSERGQGTTFKVYLPACWEAGEAPTQAVEEISGGQETILIVDDEENVRHVLQRILVRGGYTVLLASGGTQALDIYRQSRDEVALVILDIIMPRMSGQETFLRLMEIDPEVKVMLSSGYSENGQVNHILTDGAQGFLQKPYDMAMVLRKVREVLDKGPQRPPPQHSDRL